MKAILYARVSRDDLNCENQRLVLDNWYKMNAKDGDTFVYMKEEMSSRKTRPEKEKAIFAFRDGEADTIVVARLDRWARSLQELVLNVEEIVKGGGRFVAVSNGMNFQRDNYNATNQLMLQILGAFAQFEREIIRERTIEGLQRLRAEGKVLGHPKGQKNKPKLPPV